MNSDLLKEKTILIADDSLAIRHSLTNTLKKKGFKRFLEAANGAEAYDQVVKSENLDLVILDLKMPYMDGFSFLSKLRDMDGRKETPVLVITADRDKDLILKILNMQPVNYLFKPIQEAEFFQKIENLLNRS